jgi:uncharacterized membrane protein
MNLILNYKKYLSLLLIAIIAFGFIFSIIPVHKAFADTGTITNDDIKNQLNQVTGNSSSTDAATQIKTQGSNILKYIFLMVGFIFIGLIVLAGTKIGMSIEDKERARAIKWVLGIIIAIIVVASAPFLYNWAINASFK